MGYAILRTVGQARANLEGGVGRFGRDRKGEQIVAMNAICRQSALRVAGYRAKYT